jgi:IS1 family transposase
MNYVAMWFKIFYSNISTASISSYNSKLRNSFSSQNFTEKDFGLPLRLDTQWLLFLSKLLCPLELFFGKQRFLRSKFFFLPHSHIGNIVILTLSKNSHRYMNYVAMWFKIFYSNISTVSISSYNSELRNFFSSQNFTEKDFGLPLGVDTQSLLFLSKFLCQLEIFF